jgi:hypothetical protein
LAELVASVRAADRLVARAVELAGRLAGTGVCETVEGLPLEQFAGLAARMTGGDARMLVAAGETLATMPATSRLFSDGTLGWGQVRAIVAGCRRLRVAQRREIDARVAASVAAYPEGVESFDPDGLVWAVDAAVEELQPQQTERAERRAAEQAYFARQMDFDGGMFCHGAFDALGAAALNNAIDAGMGSRPPAGAGARSWGVGCSDRKDGVQAAQPDAPRPPAGGWTSTATGRAAATALVGVCADWLGGDTGRPARPLLVAHVDLNQVTAHPSGTVELNLRGPLPRIGAATLERLATDADLRAVLFDGQRPLAASGKVDLAGIPARTRFAVRARDRGCRFPGSRDPISFTDLDHLHERARGGNHDPDNLAALSRRPHKWRHDHGWQITLEPRSAMLTIRRGTRQFHSLPRGTPLARPPDDPDPPPEQRRSRPDEPRVPF